MDLIRIFFSADLRETPPVDLATSGVDYTGAFPPAKITGDFGPSNVNISSLQASGGRKQDSVFGNYDTITVIFTVATDMGGRAIGDNLTKPEVDDLLDFSAVIGRVYNGTWLDRKRLMVTIVDSSDNTRPTLGLFSVTTRKQGWIRNYPAVSGATVSQGNINETPVRLAGDFG